jgi:hypothetical protein
MDGAAYDRAIEVVESIKQLERIDLGSPVCPADPPARREREHTAEL